MKSLLLSFFLLIAFSVVAQEKLTITHGPYLQHLTDNSVNII